MKVRGVDLAVTDAGSGLALIWAHGLTSNRVQDDQMGLLPLVRAQSEQNS